MSELGTFLERFYRPEPTFGTVRAVVQHSMSDAPTRSRSQRSRPIGRPRDDANPRPTWNETLRLWWRQPNEARVESTRQKEDVTETAIEVVNPHDTWRRHFDGTLESGRRTRIRHREIDLPTCIQRHFDRVLLRRCFAALTLEPTGTLEVAGRNCLTIRAVPIPSEQLWPHWLPAEADEFELAVDVQRVAVLSIVGRVAGKTNETYRVETVAFDEDLPDSIFEYKVRPQEEIHPATPITEKLTFQEAARRASFAVLIPDHLGGGHPVGNQVIYHPARPGQRADSLTIHGGRSHESKSFWMTQSKPAKSHSEGYHWDSFGEGDQQFELSDPDPEEHGLRILSLHRHGTRVEIYSDFATDELVKIALTLKPVERGNEKPETN